MLRSGVSLAASVGAVARGRVPSAAGPGGASAGTTSSECLPRIEREDLPALAATSREFGPATGAP